MKNRLWATTAALAAAIVVLSGCTASGSTSSTPEWKPKPVTWNECSADDAEANGTEGFLCATLAVPVDYSDPEGEMTEIALSKLPATGKKGETETLLMNPGGPGVGGRQMPTLGTALLTDLAKDHDLVGFDPRGTGISAPLSCLAEATTLTGFEATEKELTAAITAQTADREACIDDNEEYVASMRAEVTARDMESIRLAIGQKKVDYLGLSWGTYLGAVFQSLFPDSVDEMVLDSAVTPDVDIATMQDEVLEVAGPKLQEFAEFVASVPEGAALGTTPDAVVASLVDITTKLQGKQVTVDDAPVGESTFETFMFAPKRLWAEAIQRILSVQKALGTLDAVEPGTNAVADGTEAAYVCNDWKLEQTAASAWQDISSLRTDHPETWTAAQGYYFGFCAEWPEDLAPRRAALKDTGAALLLVSHSHEIVTPASLAKALQDEVGGSILAIDDDIHGGAANASRCGAAALTAFFQDGTTETTSCEYDMDPFGDKK